MPKISRRRLAETIVRLLREQPKRQRDILRGVAAYLIVHKQANQLDLLVKDIARELQQSEGSLLAEVYSAFPLGNDSRNELKAYLQKATGAKTVELDESVDRSLLSGVIVRTADQELDTTARTKLQQLASLNSGGKH